MTFWSGDKLKSNLGGIVMPFLDRQIDCAAYTLRLGREAYVTPDHTVRRFHEHRRQRLDDGDQVIIPAGQFAYLLTEEALKLPHDVIGFISLKTTYKFKGLVNVSGFHVDPGFEGNLIYAVYNAGPKPVHLAQGMDLFLIWFSDLDDATPEYARDESPQTTIGPQILNEVSGTILSLQNLQEQIHAIDKRVIRFITVATTVVAVTAFIFGALLRDVAEDAIRAISGANSETVSPAPAGLTTSEKSANQNKSDVQSAPDENLRDQNGKTESE